MSRGRSGKKKIKIPYKSISFQLKPLKSLNGPIFTSADVKILSFGKHFQPCTLFNEHGITSYPGIYLKFVHFLQIQKFCVIL